jgi:signal peptidase I
MFIFRIVRTIIGLLIIFGIGYLFGYKGVKFYYITSDSMLPSLEPGDRLIGIKADTLSRGDILILSDPDEPGATVVKRLIATENSTVKIQEGTLRINGEKIHEPYLKEKPNYNLTEEIFPGKIYVLGDNRNNSADSHIWGPIPVGSVKSRIIFRYWPRSRISPIGRNSLLRHIP